ncbi:hypothetical protein [Alsobacter sp. SYSU BS001988]
MEQRVAKLEGDVSRIAALLERLEPKITEILLTGAKQADLARTQLDIADIKGRSVGVDGRMAGLEGRIAGLGDKIASLPTTWTILGIVFSTWAIGSSIVFTIAKLAK